MTATRARTAVCRCALFPAGGDRATDLRCRRIASRDDGLCDECRGFGEDTPDLVHHTTEVGHWTTGRAGQITL